jgi:hypothetical protein
VTPAKTGAFEETEVTVVGDSNSNVDDSLPGNLAICCLVCFCYKEKSNIFSYYNEYFLLGCDMEIVFIIGHQFKCL